MSEPVIPFGTGGIVDPPDPRDYVARAAIPVPERTISHRHSVPRGNQGSEGTCVGWATSWMKAWYDWKQRHVYTAFSPRDLYAVCKSLDDYPGEGTYPRLAVSILRDRGVAPETDWPYRPYQGNVPPAGVDLAGHATTQRIATYATIPSVDDAIQILLLHGPFICLVPMGEGWYTENARRTGIVDPAYPVSDNWHCVEVLGYDVDRCLIEAGGSWGSSQFDVGHHWFDRNWFALHMNSAWAVFDDTTIDARLVIEVPPDPPPPPPPPPPPDPPPVACAKRHEDCSDRKCCDNLVCRPRTQRCRRKTER